MGCATLLGYGICSFLMSQSVEQSRFQLSQINKARNMNKLKTILCFQEYLDKIM